MTCIFTGPRQTRVTQQCRASKPVAPPRRNTDPRTDRQTVAHVRLFMLIFIWPLLAQAAEPSVGALILIDTDAPGYAIPRHLIVPLASASGEAAHRRREDGRIISDS